MTSLPNPGHNQTARRNSATARIQRPGRRMGRTRSVRSAVSHLLLSPSGRALSVGLKCHTCTLADTSCRYNVAPRSQAPIIRRRDQGEGSSSGGSSSTQPGPSSRTSEPGTGGAEVESIPDEGSGHPNPAGVLHPSQKDGLDNAPLPVIMQTMRWGLVPHFSKHEDPSLKTINARCEALIEEPRGMWASIKGKKRCAVICQG